MSTLTKEEKLEREILLTYKASRTRWMNKEEQDRLRELQKKINDAIGSPFGVDLIHSREA